MIGIANPSNAERAGHPVVVPETNGAPDRNKLSETGRQANEALLDIYFNQYLVDGLNSISNLDYLVHSAELLCSNGTGTSDAYLRVEESVTGDFRKIGHGALINGLPQANKNDSIPGINIDSFKGCKLLSYENGDIRRIIVRAAADAGCDVCAYIRNMNSSWITPSESSLMEVGGDKAINMSSYLVCYPTKIQAYDDKGIPGGKIQAIDSGQSHLDNLLLEYRIAYNKAIIDASANPMFNTFTMQYVYEFIYMYEIRYPERERVLVNFFRFVDNALLEHILSIKCMTYMLAERVLRRMLELMRGKDGIFIEMYSAKNPDPKGSQAFFTTSALGKPKIVYYDIINKRGDKPPYKTFFHEFGHAIDYITIKGSMYYSDSFIFKCKAVKKELMYDGGINDYFIDTTMKMEELTIHQWAEFDLKNSLVQVAYDLLKNSITVINVSSQRYLAASPKDQYDIAINVIYERILFWNGANVSAPHPNENADLYADLCKKITEEITVSVNNSPALPCDIFGGLTNNQVGAGHSPGYWFDLSGTRLRQVSNEAFAGYFEYRLIVLDAGVQKQLINPKLYPSTTNADTCFEYTELALEGMFNNVV